jgi:hypothetical protein
MSTPDRRRPAICSPNPDAEIARRLRVLLKVVREHALSLIGPDHGAETDCEAFSLYDKCGRIKGVST